MLPIRYRNRIQWWFCLICLIWLIKVFEPYMFNLWNKKVSHLTCSIFGLNMFKCVIFVNITQQSTNQMRALIHALRQIGQIRQLSNTFLQEKNFGKPQLLSRPTWRPTLLRGVSPPGMKSSIVTATALNVSLLTSGAEYVMEPTWKLNQVHLLNGLLSVVGRTKQVDSSGPLPEFIHCIVINTTSPNPNESQGPAFLTFHMKTMGYFRNTIPLGLPGKLDKLDRAARHLNWLKYEMLYSLTEQGYDI